MSFISEEQKISLTIESAHRYLGSVGQCRPFARNVMFSRTFSEVTEYDYILSAVFLLY